MSGQEKVDAAFLAGLTQGYQGVVQNWECDANQHLNVSFYFGMSSDQAFFMRHAMGLRPDEMRAQGRGTVALEEHVRFHQEVRAAGQVIGRSAPVELGEKTMRVYHEFRDPQNNLQAAFSTLIGHFDTKARRLVPWSDETRAAFEAQRITLPDWGTPKHIAGNGRVDHITLDETLAQGFVRVGGAGINSWECDQFGHLNTMFYVRRINEAGPHIWTAAGIDSEKNYAAGFGSVVGEMCMSYVNELREGDMVETYSHISEARDKTVMVEHRLFNAQTGALSAVGRMRSVCFNTNSRRAAPWPTETRAAFDAFAKR